MQIIRNEMLRHLPAGDQARRLFHGRGHAFAGYEDLVIDWFAPAVLVMLYRERPDAWLQELVELLHVTLPQRPAAIVLQERFHQQAPSRLLDGVLPEPLDAHEEGLRYRLRLGEARNIGFFPDMAVGRRLVRQWVADKRVLNLFAYTCSFSVAALAGGAAEVVNLDMNRGALDLGRLNHELNGLDLRRTSFLPLELFRSLGKLRRLGPFDLVICDPPASQGRSFSAEKHWPKLLRKLPELVKPGGEILACFNSPYLGPEHLDGLFSAILPQARKLGQYDPGPDFPEAHAGRGVSLHHYRLSNIEP